MSFFSTFMGFGLGAWGTRPSLPPFSFLLSLAAVAVIVLTLLWKQKRELTLRRERERLQVSEERMRIALENTSVLIWDYDIISGCILQTGKLRPDYEPVIADVPESLIASGFIHPESVSAYRQLYALLREGAPQAEGIIRIRREDGEGYCYEHIRYTSLFDEEGRPYRAIGICTDVTEKHLAQQNYQRELRLRQELAADSFATLVFDVSARSVVRASFRQESEAARYQELDFAAYFQEAAKGVAEDVGVRDFYANLTAEQVKRRFENDETSLTWEYLHILADGSQRWLRDEMWIDADPSNGHLMLFFRITDIDQEKRLLDTLQQAAERDSMTGLYHHDAMLRHLQDYLNGEGCQGRHALFVIDVDNFKAVNDTLGHQHGDAVIVQVAKQLKQVFRASDLLGRVGGDEFLVLMKNVGDAKLTRHKAEELVKALQFAYGRPGSSSVQITASVGVALSRPGLSAQQLYRLSDQALYLAKGDGKNRFALLEAGEKQLQEEADSQESACQAQLIQLQMLLEHMDGGVLLAEVGEVIRITYASPSFFQFLRQTDAGKQLDSDDIWDLIWPGDRPALETKLRLAAINGQAADHVYRVRQNGQETGWRHLRAIRMPLPGPLPTLIGLVTNVTDLKEAEKRLHLAEETYRAAMTLTGAMLWRVDIEKHLLYQSRVFATALGQNDTVYENVPESLLAAGKIHPDSESEFLRLCQDLRQRREGGEYMLRMCSEGQQTVWLRSRFTLLKEGEEPARYAVGINELLPNIDAELREFQNELEFAGRFGRALLGWCRVNLSRNRLEEIETRDRDLRWRQLTSYEQLCRLRVSLIPDVAEAEDFLAKTSTEALSHSHRAGNSWVFVEYRRQEKDGSLRWTCNTVKLMRHPVSGDLYAFQYVRDIDARFRWERQLSQTPQKDVSTLLYTRETAQELMHIALAEQQGSPELCALGVIQINGLSELRRQQGVDAANGLLFTLGRLLRLLIGGQALAARLGETRFLLFTVTPDSREETRSRMDSICLAAAEVLGRETGEGQVTLTAGFAAADARLTSWRALLEQAERDCNAKRRREQLAEKS